MDRAQERKALGNAAYKAGDLDEAVAQYTGAIALEPSMAVLFSNRSACYYLQHKFVLALWCVCDRAGLNSPRASPLTTPFLPPSSSHARTASSDARIARAIHPAWGKALFREAKALAALERHQEAAKLLEDAVQLPVSKHFAERDRTQLRSLLWGVVQCVSQAGLAAPGSEASTSPLVEVPIVKRVLVNETRLLRLAKDNNVLHLQVLLDDGASPNSCNRVGQTALHIAAIWNALDVLRCLISAGADVNVQNTLRGSTPLHAAASRGSIGAARILLDHGADPLIADESAMLPFQVRRASIRFDSVGGPRSRS